MKTETYKSLLIEDEEREGWNTSSLDYRFNSYLDVKYQERDIHWQTGVSSTQGGPKSKVPDSCDPVRAPGGTSDSDLLLETGTPHTPSLRLICLHKRFKFDKELCAVVLQNLISVSR